MAYQPPFNTDWSRINSKPFVVVSPHGPYDGGDFGPNTPGTQTAGFQEAVKALAPFGGMIFAKEGVYTLYQGIDLAPLVGAQSLESGMIGQGGYLIIQGEGAIHYGTPVSGGNAAQIYLGTKLIFASTVSNQTMIYNSTGYNTNINAQALVVDLELRDIILYGNAGNGTTGCNGIDWWNIELGNGGVTGLTNVLIAQFSGSGIFASNSPQNGPLSMYIDNVEITGCGVGIGTYPNDFGFYSGPNFIRGLTITACNTGISADYWQDMYINVEIVGCNVALNIGGMESSIIQANIENCTTAFEWAGSGTSVWRGSIVSITTENCGSSNATSPVNVFNFSSVNLYSCDVTLTSYQALATSATYTTQLVFTYSTFFYGSKIHLFAYENNQYVRPLLLISSQMYNTEIDGAVYNSSTGGWYYGVAGIGNVSPLPVIKNLIGYNPQGFNTATPAVPASGTAQQNTNPYPVIVYLYGGTVTAITINGKTVFSTTTGLALAGQGFYLSPGDSIAVTYSIAPTWIWYGL